MLGKVLLKHKLVLFSGGHQLSLKVPDTALGWLGRGWAGQLGCGQGKQLHT